MEVINDSRPPQRPQKRKEGNLAGNIYLGGILVTIGLIWLLYNIGWIGYGAGLLTGGLGILFMAMDVLNIHLSFSKIVLPVLLMAAGIALIISRAAKQ